MYDQFYVQLTLILMLDLQVAILSVGLIIPHGISREP